MPKKEESVTQESDMSWKWSAASLVTEGPCDGGLNEKWTQREQ